MSAFGDRPGSPLGGTDGDTGRHRRTTSGISRAVSNSPRTSISRCLTCCLDSMMTILYRREKGQVVADVVVLDTAYRAVDVRAFYGALTA